MPKTADIGDNIVLLDNSDLYKGITDSFHEEANWDAWFSEPPEHAVIRDSKAGAGFSVGIRFIIRKSAVQLLCLKSHTSQPFSYLTLGAIATQCKISSVIALTGAHSLREDLFPGDIAIVRRASALPYPALFENRDPYGAEPTVEHYDAQPEVITKYTNLIATKGDNHLWQREIPTVTCGYAKHPTWRGELMPWAPEQFQKLRDQGADTLSSAAAGVYEAQSLMPDAQIICLNQIRSSPGADSHEQWERYKNRFHSQAVSLLLDLIKSEPASTS